MTKIFDDNETACSGSFKWWVEREGWSRGKLEWCKQQ